MQILIALTAAATATATTEQLVAPGHFNGLAALTVFALAWTATSAVLSAWRSQQADESSAAPCAGGA